MPAFIPATNDVESLPREFRFHPADPAAARTLSSVEVEAFNRDGYLKGIRLYSPEEMAGIREYFDRLLARTLAAGGDSYSISTAHRKYGRVWDLLTNPRLVAVVRDLVGPDVVAFGSHFFCKMPGDGKRVSWHQDSSYWPLTPTRTVTAWLAIDDADVENACMRFIPGSHHLGHLTYKLSEADESNVLNQTVPNAEQLGQSIDVELRAGECSVHSDLLLHGSEANTSTRRRCGLTLRYSATSVHAGLGWNEKGVIVSGTDPNGHWQNNPRPQED